MKTNGHFMPIIAIVLLLSLMLSACSTGNEANIQGSITPATQDSATAGSSTQDSEAPAETTGSSMSLGRIEGGTYTNTYAGFAIDLNSNWTYYTAQELQELPDNIADLFEDTDVGESLDSLTQITDMMAESVEDLTSINVLYQKLDMTTRLAYATMDTGAILDSVLEQKDMLVDAYKQAGFDVQTLEKVTVTFLGEEQVALKMKAQTSGVDYYTLQIGYYHLGQYSTTITFASFVEDKTEQLLELCRPLS